MPAQRPAHEDQQGIVRLLQTALEFSRITEGAFDITYASVGFMYDFDRM